MLRSTARGVAILAWALVGVLASNASAVGIVVDPTNNLGTEFTIPGAGYYKATISGGAWSWSIDWNPMVWTSYVKLYVNRPVEWGGGDQWGPRPMNWDAIPGDYGQYYSYEEAAAAGTGQSAIFHAQEGGTGIAIVDDARDWFYDNAGGVSVDIAEVVPPIPSFAYLPEDPQVDQDMTFDASSSSDPDGQIVAYEWDFGDTDTAEGEVVLRGA